MLYLAIYWIVLSVLSLGPAFYASWRLRRFVKNAWLIYLIIAVLICTAIDNTIWASIVLAAVPTIVAQSPDLTWGAALMTIGYTLRTVSVAALALALSLVFGDGPTAPQKDVL